MTREHIEFVLSEYSTDALAGKLMELFDEEAASYQHTINELNKALSKKKCGKWKRTYLDHVAMGERPSVLYCSVCCQCIAYPTNYCPNCGADMREPKDTLHKAIDNTTFAEEAYPNIKEELHKAVDMAEPKGEKGTECTDGRNLRS